MGSGAGTWTDRRGWRVWGTRVRGTKNLETKSSVCPRDTSDSSIDSVSVVLSAGMQVLPHPLPPTVHSSLLSVVNVA